MCLRFVILFLVPVAPILLNSVTMVTCFGRSTVNFTTMAARNGYRGEEHAVTTEDGYLLTVFRIRRGAKCQGPFPATPVLMVHGLLVGSDSWLDAGRDAALPYLLSDACYDTWMGNTRGNTYARRHKRLNPDVDEEFWEFSTDEVGYYDIPATIDYIVTMTGADYVNYFGYSQGGSVALGAVIERPEYSRKLGVVIVAGAPTNVRYMTSPLKWILTASARLEGALNGIGVYEAFPKASTIQNLGEYFCVFGLVRDTLCKGFMYFLDTPHPGSIAEETYETLYGHFPAGTWLRTMARYGQVIHSGIFRKYDFGEEMNLQKYGSAQPPRYDLTSVTVPTVIIQGAGDTLVTVQDSEWLASQLPNLQELFVIDDPLWNHFDLIYSRNIKISMFPKINQYLLKYSL